MKCTAAKNKLFLYFPFFIIIYMEKQKNGEICGVKKNGKYDI